MNSIDNLRQEDEIFLKSDFVAIALEKETKRAESIAKDKTPGKNNCCLFFTIARKKFCILAATCNRLLIMKIMKNDKYNENVKFFYYNTRQSVLKNFKENIGPRDSKLSKNCKSNTESRNSMLDKSLN